MAMTAPSDNWDVERDEGGSTGLGDDLRMEHTVGEAAERVSAEEVFVSEVLVTVLGVVVVKPDRLVMALVVLVFTWLRVSGGEGGPFDKLWGEEGVVGELDMRTAVRLVDGGVDEDDEGVGEGDADLGAGGDGELVGVDAVGKDVDTGETVEVLM